MHMKVVLMKDVRGTGSGGDVVHVPAGYARNYLIPNQLAQPATADILNEIERRKEHKAEQEKQVRFRFKEIARRIGHVRVTIPMKATETGSLFGKIHEPQIIKALERQGFSITSGMVHIDKPIDCLGDHHATIKLPGADRVTIIVTAVKEHE